MSESNKIKRDWFRESFDNQARLFLRSEWFNFMEKYRMNISFFVWLPIHFSQNDLKYPNFDLNVNTNLNIKWFLKDGRIVESVHPPPTEFHFISEEKTCVGTPFKIGRNGQDNEVTELGDIKKQ